MSATEIVGGPFDGKTVEDLDYTREPGKIWRSGDDEHIVIEFANGSKVSMLRDPDVYGPDSVSYAFEAYVGSPVYVYTYQGNK